MKHSDGSVIETRAHSLQTLWCRAGLALVYPPGIPPDVVITSLTDDSRRVRPGSLFVAVRGRNRDGHKFIEQAVNAGAEAIVVDRQAELSGNALCLHVEDSREALGRLAAAFYGLNDGRTGKLELIGITAPAIKSNIFRCLPIALVDAGVYNPFHARCPRHRATDG